MAETFVGCCRGRGGPAASSNPEDRFFVHFVRWFDRGNWHRTCATSDMIVTGEVCCKLLGVFVKFACFNSRFVLLFVRRCV